ncbi:MAG TPA: hypothetical protein VE287_05135, partial [Actinopolymorphaceae bacterium]|nr:hypothetical protein [Actinopolymorphaceae bacterium]
HYAAVRIRNDVERRSPGQPVKPFRYHDLGSAAYIARGRGVIGIGPFHLNGFVGWLGWLFVHIAFLTGFRNRVGAVLTWLVSFTVEARRERAFNSRDIESAQDMYAIGSRSGRLGGTDDQRR